MYKIREQAVIVKKITILKIYNNVAGSEANACTDVQSCSDLTNKNLTMLKRML